MATEKGPKEAFVKNYLGPKGALLPGYRDVPLNEGGHMMLRHSVPKRFWGSRIASFAVYGVARALSKIFPDSVALRSSGLRVFGGPFRSVDLERGRIKGLGLLLSVLL